jgi:hypothetical protein
MPARYTSFDAVRALPESALRDLLASGETVERVWAAWGLALRRGAESSGVVKRAASGDPDGGARRHFAVLLAGFGERAAIAALASSDPDEHVRATATRHLIRFARPQPTLWPFVLAQLRDRAPVVRETAILELHAGDPASVLDAAARCIRDPDRSVREALIARLALIAGSEGSPPDLVKEAALKEPEADLRGALLMFWFAREGSAGILASVPKSRREAIAIEVLHLLSLEQLFPPWASLEPMSSLSQGVRDRVFEFFAPDMDKVPLDWLLAYLAGNLARARLHVGLLVPRLAATPSLPENGRAALADLARFARSELAEAPGSEEVDAIGWDEREVWIWKRWRSDLDSLIAQAHRLCDGNG